MSAAPGFVQYSAAVLHAESGWPVFPCHSPANGRGCDCHKRDCASPAKHPRVARGLLSATTDPPTLDRWWTMWRNANIGGATGEVSGRVVLDIDPDKGGDASLARLEAELGPLPPTQTVATPRAGRHLHFGWPGVAVKSSASELGDGIDVRGDGGYVLLPGSIGVNGAAYRYTDGCPSQPAELPPAWLARLAEPRRNGRVVDDGATISDGRRNSSLTRLAGAMRRVGATEPEILGALDVVNEGRCSPPLDEAEVGSIAASVARYAPEPAPEPAAPPHERRRFTLHTAQEIKHRQPPEALVDGVLYIDTISALVGPPGAFKTFAALDLFFSVGTGLDWHGRAVRQGPGLYISAEGSRGLSLRTQAWEEHHGLQAPDTCCFLPDAVNFLDPRDIEALLDAILALPSSPAYIVIDTLARCMVGGEENSARDMGLFVAAADRVRRATGAHVQVIHHVDKARGTIRGSTALPGALDTILEVRRDGDLLTVSCAKQKDAEEFPPFCLATRSVALDMMQSSLVLEGDKQGFDQFRGPRLRVANLLTETFGSDGATDTQWKRVCEETGIGERAFYRAKKELVERGIIAQDRPGRGARFTAVNP